MRFSNIPLRAAQIFIEQFHRHSLTPQGHKFSIAAIDGIRVLGVVTVGRPVNPSMDNGNTLEVTRLCTDGTKNTCSFLYAAAIRAAKAMGYSRVITYTLATETGSSLIASGFKFDTLVRAEKWNRVGRPRRDFKEPVTRKRYSIDFSPARKQNER